MTLRRQGLKARALRFLSMRLVRSVPKSLHANASFPAQCAARPSCCSSPQPSAWAHLGGHRHRASRALRLGGTGRAHPGAVFRQ